MAKLKGLKKLNKAVTAEVAPFGIRKAVCHSDYAYYFDKALISFKITEGTIEDEWFKEFIKERFDYEIAFPFVISLLHEVGHHLANNEINGDLLDFCYREKNRIESEMYSADEEKSKALEWQYFNLPDEIMATQWAVEWAKKHPKKVRKMWQRIQKAFMGFYLKNDVEGD